MTKEELKRHCEKQIEHCELWAKQNGEEPCGNIYEEHKLMLDVLERAVILPKNVTNGEVITTLYPYLRYTIQDGRVVTTVGIATSFDLVWWNAPYIEGNK